MNRKLYKKALYIAAEERYEDEVVDTEMEFSIIGPNGYFASREEWIDMQVETWLEEAEAEAENE